jgi:hypothetical protein
MSRDEGLEVRLSDAHGPADFVRDQFLALN